MRCSAGFAAGGGAGDMITVMSDVQTEHTRLVGMTPVIS